MKSEDTIVAFLSVFRRFELDFFSPPFIEAELPPGEEESFDVAESFCNEILVVVIVAGETTESLVKGVFFFVPSFFAGIIFVESVVVARTFAEGLAVFAFVRDAFTV